MGYLTYGRARIHLGPGSDDDTTEVRAEIAEALQRQGDWVALTVRGRRHWILVSPGVPITVEESDEAEPD